MVSLSSTRATFENDTEQGPLYERTVSVSAQSGLLIALNRTQPQGYIFVRGPVIFCEIAEG